MRFQKPIKDRQKLYSGVTWQIKAKIQDLAERYDCSKSFVTNTLLADKLNIKMEEHYYDYPTIARKARRRA